MTDALLISLLMLATASGDPNGLQAGERMYRTGVLSSGDPMKAITPAGVEVPGATFACASCHTKSGLGTMDEGIRTLPINGARLFQPLYPNFQILTQAERDSMLPKKFQVPPTRPAYTDATLSAAVRSGIDPGGRTLNPVMPRYELSDADMKILAGYLKQLSAKPSPGVTDSTIALATVVTEEVSQEDRASMLVPLERSIQSHNNLARNPGLMGRMLSMREMRCCHREWTLEQWVLKGPPETWEGQLEEFYGKNPVFALVGGISTLPWTPIHRFCEKGGIPCILPITDLPVVSASDFYTIYFSEGYYQEGKAAARHLDKTWDGARPLRILQILSPGPEAGALAAGFQDTWRELGHKEIESVPWKEGTLPASAGSGSILLLWTGPESYGALRSLAKKTRRPAKVFMSSTRLMEKLWDLPPGARAFTYVTYPFREPGPTLVKPRMGGRPVIVDKEFRKNDRRIASRTRTVIDIMTNRLTAMERNFYRDHLVDLFGTLDEQIFTDYEKLIFNPGQNYGSEICHIMQLSKGADPRLLRRSD